MMAEQDRARLVRELARDAERARTGEDSSEDPTVHRRRDRRYSGLPEHDSSSDQDADVSLRLVPRLNRLSTCLI